MKYGTVMMRDEDCLMFVETAIENGSEVAEAIEDMKMIDNLLVVERNYLLSKGHIAKTSRGYRRKNSLLSDQINAVVSARLLA